MLVGPGARHVTGMYERARVGHEGMGQLVTKWRLHDPPKGFLSNKAMPLTKPVFGHKWYMGYQFATIL